MKPIIKKTFLIFVSILICLMASRNILNLGKDMIQGDHSAENVFPQPTVGFFRIPERPNTLEYNAINRLGADFAQVYFPSREFSSLSKNYETGYLDPWWRPSRYAPAIHYLCAITICKLDYGYSTFWHMAIQSLLFFLCYIMSFRVLDIRAKLWAGLLLAAFLLYVTPAGLSWLERGQFSLYVAISYLLLIMGLLKNYVWFVALSAIFAYIKWTSLPLIFVVLTIDWLNANNIKELIRNAFNPFLYFAIFFLLTLAFRSRSIHFLEGLYWQEVHALPEGISIANLMPPTYVKFIPFVLIIIGSLYVHKQHKNYSDLIPFLAGSGLLLLTYPVIAHEYNLPALLCFIPLLFYWEKHNKTFHSKWVKYGFLSFIFLASTSLYYKAYISETGILIGYLAASILFLLVPLIQTRKLNSTASVNKE